MRWILVALLLAGCTHASGVRQTSDWCAIPTPAIVDMVDRPEFAVSRVLPEHMPAARHRLERASAIELSRSSAEALVGPSLSTAGRRFYLARSGIEMPTGSSDQEIHREAAGLAFTFLYSASTGILGLVSLQPRPGLAFRINMPVVIVTELPVRAVYLACFRMS